MVLSAVGLLTTLYPSDVYVPVTHIIPYLLYIRSPCRHNIWFYNLQTYSRLSSFRYYKAHSPLASSFLQDSGPTQPLIRRSILQCVRSISISFLWFTFRQAYYLFSTKPVSRFIFGQNSFKYLTVIFKHSFAQQINTNYYVTGVLLTLYIFSFPLSKLCVDLKFSI